MNHGAYRKQKHSNLDFTKKREKIQNDRKLNDLSENKHPAFPHSFYKFRDKGYPI